MIARPPPASAVPRIVTLGELMLRLSPPGLERLLQSAELRAGFGGCEGNVAVGLAHLGLRADYITRLPDNPIGRAALHALAAEGVGTDWIQWGGGGERMGIFFVEPGADIRASRVVYDRAGSAFACLSADSVEWAKALAGASWFHGSGITPALGDGPRAALTAAIAAARQAGASVSIDLNYRPALWEGRDPRPIIEPLVEGADLLIGNPHAVPAMLGVPADDREGGGPLAPRLATRFGCRYVALTRREVLSASEHGWSAQLYDTASGNTWTSHRYQVRVVDRVGGGDSFAAGLIAALCWEGGGNRPSAETVEFAAAAGALKLTVPGDWNRVTRQEIEQLMRQWK